MAFYVAFVVAIGIFFLTFQSPADTGALTQKAQGLLERIGLRIEEKPLRHYIHYVLYLLLGFAICSVCLTKGWKLRVGMLIGCGIGILDEGVKVLLSTREFDVTDLMRDFVGVLLAVGIVVLIRRVKAVK